MRLDGSLVCWGGISQGDEAHRVHSDPEAKFTQVTVGSDFFCAIKVRACACVCVCGVCFVTCPPV